MKPRKRSPDGGLRGVWERLRYSIGVPRRPRTLTGLLRLWWGDFVIHPLFEATEACEDCGRGYPLWHATDELWLLAMGSGGGLLCPTCFSDRCEARGVVASFCASRWDRDARACCRR